MSCWQFDTSAGAMPDTITMRSLVPGTCTPRCEILIRVDV